MNRDLIVFNQEIICLKSKGWGLCNKPWWICRNEIVYFDSFGVEYFPEEIKEFIENKNIIANILRVQANDSVMCGYFCIWFIDFMLLVKN